MLSEGPEAVPLEKNSLAMLLHVKFMKMIVITGMILVSPFIRAQQPITVAVFSEATTIPFTSVLNSPIHPGVQFGTELNWKKGHRFRTYPSINVGYMFHKNLFQGVYANAELGFDFVTSFGLNLKSKLGVGYLRTYTTQQEYQLKDGQYESKRDTGNSRFMPSVALGIGYNLHKNDPFSPELFTLYQSWLEYPYSPGFIPIMTHTNIQFGGKFYISKKQSK